jgi:hypothetical protein
LNREKTKERSIFKPLKKLFHNPLLILILITLGLFTYLLNVQMKIGVPYWDVFNYLNNALNFAGIDNSGSINFLPPLVPIMTSVLFRMGYVSIDAIFIVSGLISIIGIIGLYLLLKERFNPIQSLTGTLIFMSLPVVMSWFVSGGIDIPGVVFSIWTIYFMILGVKKDSKFLYFVLPLLLVASLARYTSGLIVLPMILYLLISFNDIKKIENIKKVILGIIIEFGVLIALFSYFFIKLKLDALNISNLFFAVITSSATGVGDVGYNPNLLYFLQNLLNYISLGPLNGTYQQILNPSQGIPSILSYLIAAVVIVGLSIYIYIGISSKIRRLNKPLINNSNILKTITILALIFCLIISFYYKSFIFTEIIFLALLYLIYRFLGYSKNKHSEKVINLDFLFLSWFGAYFIFHAILPFKVDRYFITMAPALTYFIILGLSEVVDRITPAIKSSNLKNWGIYLIIGLVLLSVSTATYIGHSPKKTFTVDIGNASEWITNYDTDYKNKTIGSDYPNAVTWYLHKNIVGGFPKFYNNSDEFADYLQKSGVYYFIDSTSQPHPDLKGYLIIKTFGVVAIYKKI